MKTLINTIIFLLFLTSLSAQRAGDLYTDFNEDGYYTEDWEDTITMAFSMGMLSDGSIIVPGTLTTTGAMYDIIVSKLNDHGELVPFGNSSRGFLIDLATFDLATSMVVLPGDTILIAGVYATDPDINYPYVAKILPDGQLDENFGVDGVFFDESVAMDLTKIGVYQKEDSYSILLSGSSEENYPTLLMIDNKGVLDPSFDTDGILIVSSTLGDFNDISIDNENNILYSCASFEEGGGFLAELSLPDGSPVTSFGMGGVLEFTPADNFAGTFNTIAVDPEDNTLTVMGSYPHVAGDQDIFAYRVDASDGSADISFGIGGLVTLRSAVSDEFLRSVILQSDGKYYFGGYSDYSGTNDFFIGRLNHNGFGDTTFGTAGLVLTDLGSNDILSDIQLSQEEDILYAAGNFGESGNSAIAVAAYYITPHYEPPIGIDKNQHDALTCYPNPSTGQVTLNTGFKGPKQVQVFNITGKEVYNEISSEEKIDMNLEFLKPSIYLIKMISSGNKVKTIKLLIK